MFKKIITGKLIAETAIHVGSGNNNYEMADSQVICDSRGDFFIPGTSIAGSLRMLTTKLAEGMKIDSCEILKSSNEAKFEKINKKTCECLTCKLFGTINSIQDNDRGFPSKIWIYDAVMNKKVQTFTRDGVGIDRETNTASRGSRAKFNFEVLPRGCEFKFHIQLDEDVSKDEETILMASLEEWKNGRCYIGGNKARGCGQMRLEELKVQLYDISSPADLIAYLKGEPKISDVDYINIFKNQSEPKKTLASKKSAQGYHSFCEIDLTLNFPEGIVINDSVYSARMNVDYFPKCENGLYSIPGSSLRGVIRSQAERIARTIATNNSLNTMDFLTKCPVCDPNSREQSSLQSCDSLITIFRKENNISPTDEVDLGNLCLSCHLFGSSYFGSRLFIGDGILNQPIPILKKMDHLAIDRFTGGGKHGAKYDGMVLMNSQFKFHIFLENPKDWELGWLMLIIKDIKDNILALGYGQNKGLGKMNVLKCTLKHGSILSDDNLLGTKTTKEGIFNTALLMMDSLSESNVQIINGWIETFHEKVQEFTRETSFILKEDAYFGSRIENNYPNSIKAMNIIKVDKEEK